MVQGLIPGFSESKLFGRAQILQELGPGCVTPDRCCRGWRDLITFSNAWNGAYFHRAEGSLNGEIRYPPLWPIAGAVLRNVSCPTTPSKLMMRNFKSLTTR